MLTFCSFVFLSFLCLRVVRRQIPRQNYGSNLPLRKLIALIVRILLTFWNYELLSSHSIVYTKHSTHNTINDKASNQRFRKGKYLTKKFVCLIRFHNILTFNFLYNLPENFKPFSITGIFETRITASIGGNKLRTFMCGSPGKLYKFLTSYSIRTKKNTHTWLDALDSIFKNKNKRQSIVRLVCTGKCRLIEVDKTNRNFLNQCFWMLLFRVG